MATTIILTGIVMVVAAVSFGWGVVVGFERADRHQ